LQVIAPLALASPKIINLTVPVWIFYGSIVTIMSIQLVSVMKSCLVPKRHSVLQASAN